MINCFEVVKVHQGRLFVANFRIHFRWLWSPAFARALAACVAVWLCLAPAQTAGTQSNDATSARDPHGLLAKAHEAELDRNFSAAAQFYEDYLKAYPHDPQVLQRLGLVNYLSDRFDAAIPPLSEALKRDPTLWGSALYLGVSFYRTDRFADAVHAFRNALALKPDLSDAQFWLGCSLVALNQPEPAIPYLVRVAHDPKWGAQADDLLVKAYRKAAENAYERIAKVAPDSYRVHFVKAELLAWKGIDNEAVWEARQALTRDPNVEGAHRLIAETYWRQKNFAAAFREFQAELQANPLDAESNLRLGEFWLAKSEPAKAVTFLHTAQIGRAGAPGEAWHFLGEADLALHHDAAAIADLNQATKENAADPANYRLLAEAYRATGQVHLAEREEQLAQNPPGTGSISPR